MHPLLQVQFRIKLKNCTANVIEILVINIIGVFNVSRTEEVDFEKSYFNRCMMAEFSNLAASMVSPASVSSLLGNVVSNAND